MKRKKFNHKFKSINKHIEFLLDDKKYSAKEVLDILKNVCSVMSDIFDKAVEEKNNAANKEDDKEVKDTKDAK